MAEGILECVIQHRGADVEKGLHSRPVPAHLLFLVHALGDNLVDRTLDERRRDRFTIPAPGSVMHQRTLVSFEIAQQLVGMMLQAPDASHATYISTPPLVLPFHPASPDGTFGKPCPTAQRREFPLAS